MRRPTVVQLSPIAIALNGIDADAVVAELRRRIVERSGADEPCSGALVQPGQLELFK